MCHVKLRSTTKIKANRWAYPLVFKQKRKWKVCNETFPLSNVTSCVWQVVPWGPTIFKRIANQFLSTSTECYTTVTSAHLCMNVRRLFMAVFRLSPNFLEQYLRITRIKTKQNVVFILNVVSYSVQPQTPTKELSSSWNAYKWSLSQRILDECQSDTFLPLIWRTWQSFILSFGLGFLWLRGVRVQRLALNSIRKLTCSCFQEFQELWSNKVFYIRNTSQIYGILSAGKMITLLDIVCWRKIFWEPCRMNMSTLQTKQCRGTFDWNSG